jgi:small subunit ribosomal protein S3
VKVWIFKGEVLTKGIPAEVAEEKKERPRKRAPRRENSEKAE